MGFYVIWFLWFLFAIRSDNIANHTCKTTIRKLLINSAVAGLGIQTDQPSYNVNFSVANHL